MDMSSMPFGCYFRAIRMSAPGPVPVVRKHLTTLQQIEQAFWLTERLRQPLFGRLQGLFQFSLAQGQRQVGPGVF